MNNIGIVIGAIIISATIFFTFNKEPKIIEQRQAQHSDYDEYRSLKNKLERLQNKMLYLRGKDNDIAALQKEIENLKDRIALRNTKHTKRNEIKDRVRIYNYLNDTNSKQIHKNLRVTKNGMPYIIYSHDNGKKLDKNSDSSKVSYKDIRVQSAVPPSSPGLSKVSANGETIYFPAQPATKDVSILMIPPTTGKEVLVNQTSSSTNTIQGSPPVPPVLFEGDSSMPAVGN